MAAFSMIDYCFFQSLFTVSNDPFCLKRDTVRNTFKKHLFPDLMSVQICLKLWKNIPCEL